MSDSAQERKYVSCKYERIAIGVLITNWSGVASHICGSGSDNDFVDACCGQTGEEEEQEEEKTRTVAREGGGTRGGKQ